MLADTDVLISLADDDPGVVRKVAELEDRNEPIKIPTTALLDFYIGIGAVATDAQEREARRILERHSIVPMDEHVAMRAGRRIGKLGPKQFKKDKGDAAIGPTAEVEGEAVLTRNVEDFEALGFDVEPY